MIHQKSITFRSPDESKEVVIQNITAKRELFNDESRQETDRINLPTPVWNGDFLLTIQRLLSLLGHLVGRQQKKFLQRANYEDALSVRTTWKLTREFYNQKAFHLTFENDLELSGMNFHFHVELSILYFYCIVFIFSSKS